jgi:hypothetical protein
MEINWEQIYKYFNFIKNQDSKLICEFMIENINSNTGWFLNRIGGSDYDAVYDYKNRKNKLFNLQHHLQNTKELNGYFDKSTDNNEIEKNFIRYLKKMYKCYTNSDAYTNAVSYIQNIFLSNDINKIIYNKKICGDKKIIHYYYIESIEDFIKDFKIFGDNKKILIISPFEESIKYQTQKDRINNLINNYTFPNCEFLTYKTPITYNADNNDLINEVTTNNWLEQCEKMENEIQQLDFDIAFLSCASYATCLGSFIARKMNKKAIYIGGPLNIFFNIHGGRYANHKWYNEKNFNNLSYRITAFEKEKYVNTKGGRKYSTESFNAYF